MRNAWLNPSDLLKIEPEVVPSFPDRILPRNTAAAALLEKRTLTKLYNERPQWLDDAHRDLDTAVAAAYGWPADISEEAALHELLDLNLARGGVPSVAPGKPYVLEQRALEKINAVEGIVPSESMKEALAEFEREDLASESERRSVVTRLKQVTR